MGKYEYIGKREIMRRVRALGYMVTSGEMCGYSKFEGVEWVESAKSKSPRNVAAIGCRSRKSRNA